MGVYSSDDHPFQTKRVGDVRVDPPVTAGGAFADVDDFGGAEQRQKRGDGAGVLDVADKAVEVDVLFLSMGKSFWGWDFAHSRRGWATSDSSGAISSMRSGSDDRAKAANSHAWQDVVEKSV